MSYKKTTWNWTHPCRDTDHEINSHQCSVALCSPAQCGLPLLLNRLDDRPRGGKADGEFSITLHAVRDAWSAFAEAPEDAWTLPARKRLAVVTALVEAAP